MRWLAGFGLFATLLACGGEKLQVQKDVCLYHILVDGWLESCERVISYDACGVHFINCTSSTNIQKHHFLCMTNVEVTEELCRHN